MKFEITIREVGVRFTMAFIALWIINWTLISINGIVWEQIVSFTSYFIIWGLINIKITKLKSQNLKTKEKKE